MSIFYSVLQLSLYMAFAQNLVFTASYGISEAVRLSKRPKHFFTTSLSVTAFSIYLSVASYFADRIPLFEKLSLSFRFFFYILILTAGYLFSAVIMKKAFHADKKFLNSLGMCAINTFVIALPLISFRASLSLSEAIALAIGSGLSFTIALLLINGGMKFIWKNRFIPEFMKGTPALFIYTALLSLALSSITGESFFI